MKIRFILTSLILIGLTSNVQAKIMTKTISYQHDGVNLEGFLAYDDSLEGKRPAVLVVHEWWGLNDYVRSWLAWDMWPSPWICTAKGK